jgi:hypothetical protein
MGLPTRNQIFTNALRDLNTAYGALGDAQAWLRSDWHPVDSHLTDIQAEARIAMQAAIATAKRAIDKAMDAGYYGAGR